MDFNYLELNKLIIEKENIIKKKFKLGHKNN